MPPELDWSHDTPPDPSIDPPDCSAPVDLANGPSGGAEPFEETARKVLQKTLPDETPVPPLEATLGEEFPLLGTPRTVAASPSRDEHAVAGDTIVLAADRGPGSMDVAASLRSLYRRAAEEYLSDRVAGYARRMDRPPVPVEPFDSPTRVVDCAGEPPLGINWRVIMAPPPVVDHAVVHALAHLECEAHTGPFRDLVRRHRPPFDDEKWLDPFGIALRLPP